MPLSTIPSYINLHFSLPLFPTLIINYFITPPVPHHPPFPSLSFPIPNHPYQTPLHFLQFFPIPYFSLIP